nr:hypothetical protein [Tanacetum cinerariifolium]
IKKVAVSSNLRSLKPKRTIESRAKRSSINLIRTHFPSLLFFTHCGGKIIQRVLRIILVILPEHLSDGNAFTMKMEILQEPSSNKLLVGSYKDGVGDTLYQQSQDHNRMLRHDLTCYEVMKDQIKVSKLSQTLISYTSSQVHKMVDSKNLLDRVSSSKHRRRLEYSFFEGDGSSFDEWGDYGVAGDNYEGAPVFDDDYEEASVFDDDQFKEESMLVYDTDIEDAIEEEEEFEKPYAEDGSPIAQSPEYVPESDFEVHPEDDDDEDPEEDPVDYLAAGGDDGDDEEELSKDDEDDDMDIEADEEEHPAPADSVVVTSTAADQAPSAEETEPFETDESVATPPPHPAYRMTARISIPAPVPMPAWTDSEVGESSSAAAARPAGVLRADYGFVATVGKEILRDPEREVGYGITDSLDEIVKNLQGAPKQMAPKRTTRSTADQETINATSVTNAQLQAMIDQGVTAALAARDALRSTNGDDSHNFGTGVRRTERATREYTYTDFLKCQPLPFTGTEGVASLSQWCKRMKSVFHISNCAAKNQVKFATCTFHSVALTWWNTHVQTVGHEAAYESDKIEKYIGGLPDMIHGSVVASKPKTMQEAIEIATELMDKKIHTFAERETASKRKFENASRNTQNQQQQQSNKRQNTGRVYTAAFGEKKQYGGSKTLCAKCNYHHDGPCAPKCRNCNKIGHFTRNCRSAANTNSANNQRGTGSGQKAACYECGV